MYFKKIWKVAKTFLKGQLKKQAEDIFCREEEKKWAEKLGIQVHHSSHY